MLDGDLEPLVSEADRHMLEEAAAAGDALATERLGIEALVEDSNSIWGVEVMHIVHNPASMPGTHLYERFVAARAAAATATSTSATASMGDWGESSHFGGSANGVSSSTGMGGGSSPGLPPLKLVFHGTGEENIEPILREGMDSSKRGRHGQAFGPGEYFATRAFHSLGYCRGGRRMLIFAVLAEKQVELHSGMPKGTAVRPASGIVVVDKVERQLPLASIVISQPTEEVRHAAMLAQQATSAAAQAKAAAKRGMAKARVMKLLMMDNVADASDAYSSAVAELNRDSVQPTSRPSPVNQQPKRLPGWAHELRFYLRDLPREHVEALFPGVIPIESDDSTGGWRHRADFVWPPTQWDPMASVHARALPPSPTAGSLTTLTAKLQRDEQRAEQRDEPQIDVQVLLQRAADAQAAAHDAEARARRVKTAGRRARKKQCTVVSTAPPSASSGPDAGAPSRGGLPLSAPTATPPATVHAVLRELKRMRGHAEFSVTLPDEANLLQWRVEMVPPPGGELQTHMAAAGFGVITLALTFGFDHPTSPPFVRVVSPRFAFHTGHVTVGGSICMELLTTKGWDPAFSIEATLVMVRDAIVSGGGVPDPVRAHLAYTEEEARFAFLRVARQHGWEG